MKAVAVITERRSKRVKKTVPPVESPASVQATTDDAIDPDGDFDQEVTLALNAFDLDQVDEVRLNPEI